MQDLAKPLVGRHLGLTGGTSYPSGTVAAVAALATAAVLVGPRLLRPLIAVAGGLAAGGALVTSLASTFGAVSLIWRFRSSTMNRTSM